MNDEDNGPSALLLPVRLPDEVSEREAAEFETGLDIIRDLILHMRGTMRGKRRGRADEHE